VLRLKVLVYQRHGLARASVAVAQAPLALLKDTGFRV